MCTTRVHNMTQERKRKSAVSWTSEQWWVSVLYKYMYIYINKSKSKSKYIVLKFYFGKPESHLHE